MKNFSKFTYRRRRIDATANMSSMFDSQIVSETIMVQLERGEISRREFANVMVRVSREVQRPNGPREVMNLPAR